MRRTGKIGFGAFAGAAALALSFAAIAPAQQAQGTASPPAEAEIAASPAVKRLKELLAAVNSGNGARMKAYAEANGMQPPGSDPSQLIVSVLDLHRRSRGLDLIRVAAVEDGGAVAVVRNRLTGDTQALSVRIEPKAPHRITGIPFVPPAVAAKFTGSAPVVARSEREQLQQIGAYLKRLGDADVFSGVVVIARDGKPVFAHAYGYADREKKIANTVDTPFLLGSMNKLFTGLAIGQLVEQGKLSYDDPLSKFLPDYPDAQSAKKIKIKHLLSHTSGLGGYWSPAFFASIDRMRTVQAVLDAAERQPPEFEPGTKWAYSNLGFHLLGRVIEVVTGEDYYDHMRKTVFAPAGVTNDLFPHYDRDGAAMAQPYEFGLNGDRLDYLNELATGTRPRGLSSAPRGHPAGGGIASAPDLIRLSTAIHSGRIVKPETLRLHISPKPELASPSYGYGFFQTWRETNRPFVGHGGNAPGMCTEFGVLTDTPYTIAVLSNVTRTMCISVAGKILQLLPPTKASAG